MVGTEIATELGGNGRQGTAQNNTTESLRTALRGGLRHYAAARDSQILVLDGKIQLAAALMLLGRLRIREVCELRHRDVVVSAASVTIRFRGKGGLQTVTAGGLLRDLLAGCQGEPDDLVIGWTCAALSRMLQHAMRTQGITASVHALRHSGVATMVAGE